MALVPCTVCGRRPFGKPVSVYVSWFLNGDRFSFRHGLCRGDAELFAENLRQLKPLRSDKEDEEWPETCSVCGQLTTEDLEPVYLTIFPPRAEQLDLVIPTCSICQTNIAGQLSQGAIKQVDRLGPSRNGSAGAPALPTRGIDWLGST